MSRQLCRDQHTAGHILATHGVRRLAARCLLTLERPRLLGVATLPDLPVRSTSILYQTIQ